MTELEQQLRQEFLENLIANPSYDSLGQKIEYTEEELNAKVDTMIEFEKNNTMKWTELRSNRNQRLSSSDWTQLADNQLSEESKLQWTEYRQQLRDFPSTVEFPSKADFPRFPGEVRPGDADFIQ